MPSDRSGSGQDRVVSLPAQPLLGPRRIMLVQDDLRGQEHLLGMACHLAKRLRATLLIEHVVEREAWRDHPTYVPTDPRTAERLIDRVLDRLETEGIHAQGEVTVTLSGSRAQAILSAAAESGADLVIIEARRFSPFLALVGLSPIHRIVRSGHCPILLVPAVSRLRLALRLSSWFRRL